MFTFDDSPKTIIVTPQSKAGSKVGTIRLYIDKARANNRTSFNLRIGNPYFTIHNKSGEKINHYHEVHPTFHFLVNNKTEIRSNSPFFYFRDLSSAQCMYNSTTYLTVLFDIVLSSDSLYHLGDQVVYLNLEGHVFSPEYNVFRPFDFRAKLYLHVQAGSYE